MVQTSSGRDVLYCFIKIYLSGFWQALQSPPVILRCIVDWKGRTVHVLFLYFSTFNESQWITLNHAQHVLPSIIIYSPNHDCVLARLALLEATPSKDAFLSMLHATLPGAKPRSGAALRSTTCRGEGWRVTGCAIPTHIATTGRWGWSGAKRFLDLAWDLWQKLTFSNIFWKFHGFPSYSHLIHHSKGSSGVLEIKW